MHLNTQSPENIFMVMKTHGLAWLCFLILNALIVKNTIARQINWQYKHFPLGSQNPNAIVKAIAAECAAETGGNRAFWVYLQQMMDGQGQGIDGLQLIAENVGLDTREFVSCVKSGKHEKTIDEHIAKAKALGVNSTPITYLVDNHTGKNIMLRGMVAESSVIAALQKLKQISDASLNETKNQKPVQKGNT